ncbi:Dabb family protein [Fodinicurvata sediminis]|uniref:Dabb family protein n=1 Tax=Fodinicurvata sediminis TaxID=1121832 RepID=UPI0003B5A6D9|nr:Dabb family protein [Fodinicurvata sediminis]
MIRHMVFFTVKNPADLAAAEAGLKRLEQVSDADVLQVRRNLQRDQLGNEVDLVVYGEFADADKLAAFKDHPLYEEAIALVRPLRDLRIAADVEV